jgi:hypothetical protein
MRKQLLILLMVPALIFTACKKDDDTPPDPQLGTLELNMTNLAPSDAGEQYEGWIVVNGTPVSTGTFTVNANGDLSQSSFMLDPETLDVATDFVLSIEPMPDNDPAPSAIKILGWVVTNIAVSAIFSQMFAKIRKQYFSPTRLSFSELQHSAQFFLLHS